MLLGEAAQRTLRAGRWDDAERLADRTLALRPGGLVEGVAHATVAQVAAARGDPGAARDGLRACARAARDRRFGDVDRRRSTPAPPSSSCPRAERPRRGTSWRAPWRGARARSTRSSPAACTGLGVRAEAELAEAARARADGPAEREARVRGADLAGRIAGQVAAAAGRRARAAPLRGAVRGRAHARRASRRTRPRGTRRSRAPTRSASRPPARTPAGAAPRRRSRSGSATWPPSRCAPPRRQRPGSAPGRCWRRSAPWRGAAASSSATPRTRDARGRPRPHGARARRPAARRRRPHQPRDRRRAVHEPEDRERPRLADPAQARRPRPRRGGRRRAPASAWLGDQLERDLPEPLGVAGSQPRPRSHRLLGAITDSTWFCGRGAPPWAHDPDPHRHRRRVHGRGARVRAARARRLHRRLVSAVPRDEAGARRARRPSATTCASCSSTSTPTSAPPPSTACSRCPRSSSSATAVRPSGWSAPARGGGSRPS